MWATMARDYGNGQRQGATKTRTSRSRSHGKNESTRIFQGKSKAINMRTRSEIESIVTSAYVGSERQSKVTDALLEVMMDIRDALLDPVGTTSTYNTAAKEYAENMTKVAEIQ